MASHMNPAEETTTDAGDPRAGRIRARWGYAGFGIGILIGLIQAAICFALNGWRSFPVQLLFALIYWPLFAGFLGYHRAPAAGDRKVSWRRLRFGTRTLMLLVAYSALLCAVAVLTAPIGRNASVSFGKYTSSRSMADLFGGIAKKAETEGPMRLRNAALLRQGIIPEGITQGQKDFLRSLDHDATPEYRTYRYGLIADGEERLGRLDEHNAVIMRGLTEYHRGLADKYAKAMERPWLPVEPDPPMPPTQ
ncbi:MAG: hypothetical protein U0790_01215 [Isosphaeraceae bacterium]